MTDSQTERKGNSNQYIERQLSRGKISLPPVLRTHYYLIPVPGALPNTSKDEVRLYPKGTSIEVNGELTDAVRRIHMTTNGQLTIPKRHREQLSFYDPDESRSVAVYQRENYISIQDHPDNEQD